MKILKSKKAIVVMFSLILFLLNSNLYSSDLIVLKNGTVQIGELVSFNQDESIKFKSLDGEVLEYPHSSVLTTRTSIDIDNVISQSLSPTYNMIQYYPRKNEGIYELSPRFKYKSQTFIMESMWGRHT